MEKAFVMLTASRVDAGPVNQVAGALQQETRLYQGDQCVCVILCTFPPGSPEWEKWNAARTLDTQSLVRTDSVQSDAPKARRFAGWTCRSCGFVGFWHGIAHCGPLADDAPDEFAPRELPDGTILV